LFTLFTSLFSVSWPQFIHVYTTVLSITLQFALVLYHSCIICLLKISSPILQNVFIDITTSLLIGNTQYKVQNNNRFIYMISICYLYPKHMQQILKRYNNSVYDKQVFHFPQTILCFMSEFANTSIAIDWLIANDFMVDFSHYLKTPFKPQFRVWDVKLLHRVPGTKSHVTRLPEKLL